MPPPVSSLSGRRSRPKHSNTFPRWPLQLPDALTRRLVKRPGDLDLWPFDPESGVRVTCDVGYLCASFGLPRPLCSRLRPDVRDKRQTDRRQTKASLNAPPIRGAGIIILIRPNCTKAGASASVFLKTPLFHFYNRRRVRTLLTE